ncbi:hypothetical protein [Lacibacter sp.]|uniref:hypothetical protein n=1 Tax=Lacibacter sp. TaxID=1915409 RepID=UPI002B4B961C|nr:hypothetical protein [Lacibacter sp.]HLP38197.1 hypothetical protein [Lacibacter sp.]
MKFSLIVLFAFCFLSAKTQLPQGWELSIGIKQYDANKYNEIIHSFKQQLSTQKQSNQLTKTLDALWEIEKTEIQLSEKEKITDFSIHFLLKKGTSPQTSVSTIFQISDWSVRNFVFTPGSTYAGNRFESRNIDYSPRLMHPKDVGLTIPAIITDVPRLNIHDGPSRIQLTSGSAAWPCIGYWDSSKSTGYLIVTTQGNELGDFGIEIEENRFRNVASISISAPHVRQPYRYFIANNHYPSTDEAHNFKTGDSITISCRLHTFPAETIAAFYDYYFQLQGQMLQELTFTKQLPFSKAYELIEAKYNQMNWNNAGFYAMDALNNNRNWKPGWVSGMPAAYALWLGGADSTRQRIIKQNDWALPDAIAPSGFFYERGMDGKQWIGGDLSKFHTHNWHLIRSSADALYYSLKLLKQQSAVLPPIQIQRWNNAIKTVVNTFIRTWKRYGQFGQFVNSQTGEIIVGGSASAGIISAALVEAADYFDDSSYLHVAKDAALYFYKNFISKGYTTGGPGDALQNPDSESCYALLESFVALYEKDENLQWLEYAEETAKLFATWVMPYHYQFPLTSTLGQLKAETGGTVWANTQNRHGGPGICTASGLAFFKLYRATGNKTYMHLLRVIAQTIPQYVSRNDRPIKELPAGCIDERISTCDWYEGIGEMTGISTWAEISMMLTAKELPGIYIRNDKSELYILDHVNASLTKKNRKTMLTISNPTKFPAQVFVFIDENLTSTAYKNDPKIIIVEVAANRSRKLYL